MNLNNPIVIDNETYDKAIINLAISTNYTNGVEDLNMALRIVPTRIDSDGNAIMSNSNSIGIFRGRLSEINNDKENVLVQNLLVNLQSLINERT